MKKSEIAAALSATIAIVIVNSIGIEKIPPQVKIITLIATPLFILWIILKYKKTKKQQLYTMITFVAFIITFYIGAIAWIIDIYYHQYYKEYRSLIAVLLIGSSIVTLLTAIICKKLIDKDEVARKKDRKQKH